MAVAAIAAVLTVPPGPAQATANPYRVEGLSANDASSPKTAVVSCNGNDRLLGLGGKIDNGSGDVLLTRLVPDLANDEVTALGVENIAVATAWQVIVWAICAPAGTEPANLQIVTDSTGPDATSPKTVDADCPVDTATYSVGYQLSQGTGQVAIDEVEFEPTFVTGSVTAYAYNGFGGNWTLDTYVICGAPSPNMQLKEWTSARNSITPKTETTPICDGTRNVHGVGAVVEGARGDASIATLNPRPQLTVGEATVREIGTTGDLWEVKVQAICAD